MPVPRFNLKFPDLGAMMGRAATIKGMQQRNRLTGMQIEGLEDKQAREAQIQEILSGYVMGSGTDQAAIKALTAADPEKAKMFHAYESSLSEKEWGKNKDRREFADKALATVKDQKTLDSAIKRVVDRYPEWGKDLQGWVWGQDIDAGRVTQLRAIIRGPEKQEKFDPLVMRVPDGRGGTTTKVAKSPVEVEAIIKQGGQVLRKMTEPPKEKKTTYDDPYVDESTGAMLQKDSKGQVRKILGADKAKAGAEWGPPKWNDALNCHTQTNLKTGKVVVVGKEKKAEYTPGEALKEIKADRLKRANFEETGQLTMALVADNPLLQSMIGQTMTPELRQSILQILKVREEYLMQFLDEETRKKLAKSPQPVDTEDPMGIKELLNKQQALQDESG